MARKKIRTLTQGSAPWLNTFADLMNLLLCFFVMLFAFSDINVEKFEKVSISMANSFGIKDTSSDSDVKEMIGLGVTQLSGLDRYYTAMNNTTGGQNTASYEATVKGETAANQQELNDAIAKLNGKMQETTSDMYDKLSDLAGQYQLTDYVELSVDPDYKYVELTMKGSVLYDSGKADIRKSALPVLTNIGNLLKKFDGYHVEITGYTDNVPMAANSEYKDNNWLSSARALNAAQYLIDQCGIDPSYLKYSGRGEYDPIASNSTEKGRAKNRRIEIKIYNQYSTG